MLFRSRSSQGIRKAGTMLRMGMSEATALSGETATDVKGQTQILYKLLTSDTSKLSEPQKKLRENLLTSGITSDLFVGDDKSKAISAPKLSDLGANFAKEMNKKNLLSKDEGKGGPMEVSFADGTEFRMKGVVRIDGGEDRKSTRLNSSH